MKKKYQILYKGIYSNELSLFETTDPKVFQDEIQRFKNGLYSCLILLDTNITRKCL